MLSERNTGILLFSTEQYKQIGEGGGGGFREFGGGGFRGLMNMENIHQNLTTEYC